VFVGQAMGAFELDEEAIIHHQVGYVFADGLTFVSHAVGDLRRSGYASKRELLDESALVDLFEKTGAEDIRDLIGGTDYSFGESV
jgi:hypothetical protein